MKNSLFSSSAGSHFVFAPFPDQSSREFAQLLLRYLLCQHLFFFFFIFSEGILIGNYSGQFPIFVLESCFQGLTDIWSGQRNVMLHIYLIKAAQARVEGDQGSVAETALGSVFKSRCVCLKTWILSNSCHATAGKSGSLYWCANISEAESQNGLGWRDLRAKLVPSLLWIPGCSSGAFHHWHSRSQAFPPPSYRFLFHPHTFPCFESRFHPLLTFADWGWWKIPCPWHGVAMRWFPIL